LQWINALVENKATPLGTIMLSVLPILVGLQFFLAFVGFDIANVPRRAIHEDLPNSGLIDVRAGDIYSDGWSDHENGA
jgi:hypothetical protein